MTIKEIFPQLKVGMRVRIKTDGLSIGIITRKDTDRFFVKDGNLQYIYHSFESSNEIEILPYAVSVKTKKEWNSVVSKLLSDDWLWKSGKSELLTNEWNFYEEDSVIEIHRTNGITYWSACSAKSNNYTIISAQEFLDGSPPLILNGFQIKCSSVDSINQLQKTNKKTMIQKLTDSIKKIMNPDFYEQYEAGYITERGELMTIVADSFKKELAERAKAEVEEEKNKNK